MERKMFKTISTYLSYVPKQLQMLLVFVAIALISAVAVALPGDSRPTKPYSQGVAGFDYVTFNSFTGVPNIGDERNFVTGKIAGAAGGFYDPMTKLRRGDEVLVRVYIHNGADESLNESGEGIARNVKVRATLPNGSQTNHTIVGYVSADNAQPGTVADELKMNAENGGSFELEYIPGSTQLTVNDANGNPVTTGLPDGITSANGISLGDIEGCFEYVHLVTFKVKVNSPRYSVAKQVRFDGSGPGNWKENVDAKPGDKLDWKIEFKNLGDTQLNNVKIVDEVPAGMTVVPSTVELVSPNNPNGYKYPDNAIQANGRQINIDIGDYAAGSNAFVYFKTTVDGTDSSALKECEVTVLNNRAFATPEGYGAVVDNATATVGPFGECDTPPETPPTPPSGRLPDTGIGSVLGGAFGTSALGLGIKNWIVSRRALKAAMLKG